MINSSGLSVAENIDALCTRYLTEPAETLAAVSAEYALARSRGEGLALASLAYGAVLLQAADGRGALEALAESAGADVEPEIRLQGMVYRSKALTITGYLQEALECFREGLELAKSLGQRHTEGVLLTNLGFFHGQIDESVPYEEYTRLALAIFRELDDRRRIALCLNNLAGSIIRRQRYDEASGLYGEALALALELDWRRGQALILAGLGSLLVRQGEIEAGRARYVESNAILEGLGDTFQLTRHQGLLGESLLNVGRPAEAIPFLERAVRDADALRLVVELSQSLALLSNAYEAVGDAPAALHALRRHLGVTREAGRRETEQLVSKLKFEHRLAVARREAELLEARNVELATVNEALTTSLERQRELQAVLERLASTDALTGLCNRRQLQELGEREIARCLRASRSLIAMFADLDHFKAINDRFGHAVGDEVLVELAARMRGSVRTTDLAGRWGGEEFCLLLVETDLAGALVTAERLRAAVSASPFRTTAGALMITISIGVAALRSGETLHALLERADLALYAAKGRGRDRVCAAEDAAPEG